MTTFNVHASTDLQTLLKTPGIHAWAFWFGQDPGTGSIPLLNTAVLSDGNGHYQDATYTPTVPVVKMFVAIQQGSTPGDLATHIADGTNGQGFNPGGVIKASDAVTYNYAYQLFETSLTNSPNDLGDISAVNTFGLSSSMQVVFADQSSDIRGFKTSADKIFLGMPTGVVQPWRTPITNPNTPNREGVGPAEQYPNTYPASDWTNYVNALAASPTTVNDLSIVATYVGSGVNARPALSVYGLEYDATTQSFWLAPKIDHGGTNTDWIRIPQSQLSSEIYTQGTSLGELEVHAGSKTGPLITLPAPYNASYTPNTASGTVVRDFVAGFDSGLWGGSGSSPNPLVTTPINLNHNTNWGVNYIFNGGMNPGLVNVTNAISSGAYDKWAASIQTNGNAYGWSYSDLASAGGINPQITMWDATAKAQVPTINIELFADGETPPASHYKPVPTTYVAPPVGGQYAPASTMPTFLAPYGYASEIDFAFNFSSSTLNFSPKMDSEITFKFYVGQEAHKQAVDGFIPLKIDGVAPNGDWYNYTVNYDSSSDMFSLTPGAQHTQAGTFSLFNLPTTADSTSTSWYQLEFGPAGGSQKDIYNIYATNADTSLATHTLTSLVVDRAVQTTVSQPDKSPKVFSLNLAPGGSPTYDIASLAGRASHDINADGRSDLILQKDGIVWGWEQNGASGTSRAGQIGTPSSDWQAKFVGDFYGDGGSDVIFQNDGTISPSLAGEVWMWKQNGLTISAHANLGNPGPEWQVKGAGDVNGDGATDLVFQNSNTGDVWAWFQHKLGTEVNGSGLLGSPGTSWQLKGVADFLAVGHSGLVFQNGGSGEVAIWNLSGSLVGNVNQINPINSIAIVGNPGTDWQIKGTGDFNGDGYADIVFQNTGSGSHAGDVAFWQMNTKVVQLQGPPVQNITVNNILTAGTVGTPGSTWQVAATGDYNGDGLCDLAFQNTVTGQVYEWQMNKLQDINSPTVQEIGQAIDLGYAKGWHIV